MALFQPSKTDHTTLLYTKKFRSGVGMILGISHDPIRSNKKFIMKNCNPTDHSRQTLFLSILSCLLHPYHCVNKTQSLIEDCTSLKARVVKTPLWEHLQRSSTSPFCFFTLREKPTLKQQQHNPYLPIHNNNSQNYYNFLILYKVSKNRRYLFVVYCITHTHYTL